MQNHIWAATPVTQGATSGSQIKQPVQFSCRLQILPTELSCNARWAPTTELRMAPKFSRPRRSVALLITDQREATRCIAHSPAPYEMQSCSLRLYNVHFRYL